MPLDRRLAVLVTAAALAADIPAQSDRWTTMVHTAIADLDDRSRHDAACERLLHAGPRLVPVLRAELTSPRYEELSLRQRQALLCILARAGRPALPALPEIRYAFRGDDPATTVAACWALVELLPFCEPETADAVVVDVDKLGPVRRELATSVLWWMAKLVADPSEQHVLRMLGDRSLATTAACRWLRIRAADLPLPRAPLVDALAAARRDDAERPAFLWDERWSSWVASDLADAWLALGGDLDAITARGLLEHWDADARRRGVLWLEEHGADLPVRERIDLVLRLWDGDARVRTRAAEALGRWGRGGLVGLACLRHLQREHDDETFRSVCASNAAAIAAACADLPAADRALLAAVDHALQRLPPAANLVLAPASADGQQLASEVLHLARWCHAAALAPVLTHLDAAGAPSVDAVQAVVGWLRHDDADVVALAWNWLAHRPAATRDAFAAGGREPFARWGAVIVANSPPAALAEAIEALAWIESRDADTADLPPRCRSTNGRVVARALAELLARGDDRVGVDPDRLRALLDGATGPTVAVADGHHEPLAADLRPVLTVLAALQLAAQGEALPNTQALDELTTTWCSSPVRMLPATLALWRQTGELRQRLDALEAEARRVLQVRPTLRWPVLAPAR